MSVFPDDIFAADPLAAVIEEKTLQLKEGERRNVSILFADLKGFTEMSEKLDPEFVQTTIDKIMSVFTQVIKNHGGYVDKYSGDEVMALFGAKVTSEVDTERAIRAGIQMLSNLDRFNQYMKSQKEYSAIDKPLAIQIGINTDLVTTGKIGEGREVSRLIDAKMDAGYHSIAWNANNLSSGIYFVKMVAGGHVVTQKLMLLK